jgi:hypothetical protein
MSASRIPSYFLPRPFLATGTVPDMDRDGRLRELAAAARSASDRGAGWTANELWREYELVRDGGRDPDDLLAEGLRLSRMAADLAGQAAIRNS